MAPAFDGVRKAEGGEGATGEIAWVPFGVGRSADGLGPYGRLRELRCAGWRENTQQGTLSDRAGASLRGSSVVRAVIALYKASHDFVRMQDPSEPHDSGAANSEINARAKAILKVAETLDGETKSQLVDAGCGLASFF